MCHVPVVSIWHLIRTSRGLAQRVHGLRCADGEVALAIISEAQHTIPECQRSLGCAILSVIKVVAAIADGMSEAGDA